MIVTINNKTYRYFFKHLKNRLYYEVDADHELKLEGKDRKKWRAATTCKVQQRSYESDFGNDGSWQDLVIGATLCNKSDRFVKEIGRCYALADALDQLEGQSIFNMKDSELFCNHYLNRNLDERFNKWLYKFVNKIFKEEITNPNYKDFQGVIYFYA